MFIRNSGNPQGKGTSTTLSLLDQAEGAGSVPELLDDGPARIVEDYLATLLVVSCEFRFKPVPGVQYYLYLNKGRLVLSLISPDEGGGRIFDDFVGSCCLKTDLAWSVELLRTECVSTLFAPEMLTELEKAGKGRQSDVEHLRALLDEIANSKDWHFNSSLGYYQNVMLFLAQKCLRRRLERLREYGTHLDVAERGLLLSI